MSSLSNIIVKGARENNLKNISFEFPKNQLVVFTGVSGSGKSSMAFDTLFAEGQRRYVESLSSYARQFLGNLHRPEVDLIEGLSPSIAINQKAISHNPRSTVGTVTEIYDYLRLLFARVGHPHCPHCGREVIPQTSKQIVDQLLEMVHPLVFGVNVCRFLILAPLVRNKNGDFRGLIENLRKQGYKWIRADNRLVDLYSDFGLTKTNKHNLDVVIDRVSLNVDALKNEASTRNRLIDDVEQAMKLSNGLAIASLVESDGFDFPLDPKKFTDTLYSENYACPVCNLSLPAIEPSLFSFNSPAGACPDCKGLGSKFQIDRSKFPEWKAKMLEGRYVSTTSEVVRDELEKLMIREDCPVCHGSRLNPEALSVTVGGQNINQVCQYPIEKLNEWINHLDFQSSKETEILEPIKKEILSRLEFLLAVGLDYLSLDREAGSLSSGESQRIRLASQIGTGLTGVLYILDEPTIGLHSRDNDRLIATLQRLRDLGNSVVVVEHDEDVIRHADHIVDFGLYAGKNGGEIVAQGTLADIEKNPQSLTGKYLSGKLTVSNHQQDNLPPVKGGSRGVFISNCHQWNLKNINVNFPLNKLISVTGVSGSGKSTLVHDTLYGGVRKQILGSYYGTIGQFDKITGCDQLADVLLVDQSPIGRTPRSNPATYTKIFDDIRQLLSQTTEAQIRGFGSGRFSFNVKGGRCEACEGQGQIKVEMQFLPDIYVTCDQCHGTRYKEETLEVFYKGKNIAEILKLTVDEAADFFKNITSLKRKLTTIQEVGLGYLQLGQPSNTLSGGESQRLKISRELVKKINGRLLYVLDEPTTGLHFYDVDRLIKVLRRLVDMGNTVVVIEHNLDVIKNSDWVIDLGPEGGDKGGYLVAAGSPADIAACPTSHTGRYLSAAINRAS